MTLKSFVHIKNSYKKTSVQNCTEVKFNYNLKLTYNVKDVM